jgi:hypothetical protein
MKDLIECFGPQHVKWVDEIVWNPVVTHLTEEQHGWVEDALNTVEWEWVSTRWPEGAEL